MTFPVFAGNSASTGYNLTRSLRFRSSATAYLSRTPAAATNQQIWTWSSWVKRGSLAAYGTLLNGYNSGANQAGILFWIDDTLVFSYTVASTEYRLTTTQVFRDPSAWYHIVYAMDTTQATAANRVKLYVNGTQVTAITGSYPPQNSNLFVNSTNVQNIGRNAGGGNNFDGYTAETNLIDGQQLTPSSFGSTNALTGVWQPASYTGAYGTNGFELNFTDNSALTTSSNVGLGKDFSGNGNYWTTNNISITAGVTYDSMTDVPTLTSATAANFAVLNPLDTGSNITLSAANLQTSQGAAAGISKGTIGVSSGKWYWEVTLLSGTTMVGIATVTSSPTQNYVGQTSTSYGYYSSNGNKYNNATGVAYGASYTTNDVIGVALDLTAGTLTFYKNNTSQGTAYSSLSGTFTPAIGNDQSNTTAFNAGQRPFTYTPPTGFVALNTYNLPTSTIVKGNTVMDATLWTGNGATRSIVNDAAFKPDLVWSKARSAAIAGLMYDSVRGATKYLQTNVTSAEGTGADSLTAFNSNGFALGADTSTTGVNQNGTTYVGWQWQAGQGTSSSNTNGTITSTVSVNASAGFSVVTYTGTGANATVGHGLGVAPSLVIVKVRSTTNDWVVYHSAIGNTGAVFLDLTNATSTSVNYWNNTSPTSSNFSIGIASGVNNSGSTFVAYCWTPIAGFSAMGSYSGNNSTDGPMVYTGFQPKFVLIKGTGAASGWQLQDSARNTYNVVNAVLRPDLSAAESTGYGGVLDFLSNGFKLRTTDTNYNSSSYGPYIYMAFATNPFKNSLGV
jgi:hypothetical protein